MNEIDKQVAAIVLAAGASRRMGSNKALLPIAGKPMLLGVVESLLISAPQIAPVIVVTGHEREAIGAVLEPVRDRLEFAHNPDFDRGKMLSSVKIGLRSLHGRSDACFIVLGDQPLVQPATIELLMRNRAPDADVVRPVYQSRHAHPILIAMRNLETILNLPDSATLNDFVAAASTRVLDIPVDDPATINDVDTPADYDALRDR